MALADLQAALVLIDAQILALATSAEKVESYSIEGLSVDKKTMAELLAERKALQEAIGSDPENLFEIKSRWIV